MSKKPQYDADLADETGDAIRALDHILSTVPMIATNHVAFTKAMRVFDIHFARLIALKPQRRTVK